MAKKTASSSSGFTFITRVFWGGCILFLLPWIIIVYQQSQQSKSNEVIDATTIMLGVEKFSPSLLSSLSPKKNAATIGLLTNYSGKDQQGKRTIDILVDAGIAIKKIFVPEHGLSTRQEAGKTVDDIRDEKTGIAVISLYNNGRPQEIAQKELADIDIVIFDLQELGIRHNTYLTMLFQVLESVARAKKPLLVFDRPNLLGMNMEGPLVENGVKTSISYAAIPLRYGMTVGELALYYNKYFLQNKARVYILPLENYMRLQVLPDQFFTQLTPNLTTRESCYGYSFLGLLGEVRPFDIGVGTEHAFKCIVLPDSIKFPTKHWYMLQIVLKKYAIDSSFIRFFNKKKNNYCSGLRLYISDIQGVHSLDCVLAILSFFRDAGIQLSFSQYFDKAIGTTKVREYIQGNLTYKELRTLVNNDLYAFYQNARQIFIYKPYPVVYYL